MHGKSTTNGGSPSPRTEETAAGWTSFAALGVVFGDLGTSPLYTLQTVVQATGGQFTPQSALGILSAIVWTLLITISVKYCLFVMRADNHGEGGILALMSLIGANGFAPGFRVLTSAADACTSPTDTACIQMHGAASVAPNPKRSRKLCQ